MNRLKYFRMLAAVLLVSGISACGKTPAARFYTLSPATVENAGSRNVVSQQVIGIGPVTIAAYLDRPEIVTRSSTTSIELAAFDRWAEPFEDIVTGSLADSISSMLPSVQAIVDPWPEADVKYQLVVKIKKFESDKDGNVRLTASWGLLQPSSRKMKKIFESDILQQGSSAEFSEITKNMSLALTRLSEEMVTEIKKALSE